MPTAREEPLRDTYDVVIVGGAVIGSSIAWALSANDDFGGTVLVAERDPSYAQASTSLTNSCMRQQFSNPLNVQISRFGADFVRNFRKRLGGDPEVPDLFVHHFGYMYLAGDAKCTSQATRTSPPRCGATRPSRQNSAPAPGL